jgi:NAD(P)-dependent dehydrogenase (short-subunit alcohol dehydrogenase family)
VLTECLGAELAGQEIGVTAICPGFVNTGTTSTAHFAGVDAEEEKRRQRRTAGCTSLPAHCAGRPGQNRGCQRPVPGESPPVGGELSTASSP